MYKKIFALIGILFLVYGGSIGALALLDKRIKVLEQKVTQFSDFSSISPKIEKEGSILTSPKTEEWQTLKKIEGVGDKKSELFFIEKKLWRIKYQATGSTKIFNEGEFPSFYISIYKEGDEKPFKEASLFKIMEMSTLEGEVEEMVPASDSEITYINEGNKNFYLKIDARLVNDWSIDVQTY